MSNSSVRTMILAAIAVVVGLLVWSYYKSRKAAQAAQALANATAPSPGGVANGPTLNQLGTIDQFLGSLPGLGFGL